ncbi:3'-5' exonuclease [Beggiatoa alba]|nr:3'-5' exonuclease [Beggiatoa alba]
MSTHCTEATLLKKIVANDKTRFVVLDTETTGLLPYAGDEIVSISLLEMRGLEFTGREYKSLVNPRRSIPVMSTALHRISDSDVANSPYIDDILDEIVEFIGDAIIVGHHVNFDLCFINKALQRKLVWQLPNLWIDTMLLYIAYSGNLGHYSLDDVAKSFQIKNPARHTASGDAQVTGQIFQCMTKQLLSNTSLASELIDLQYKVMTSFWKL